MSRLGRKFSARKVSRGSGGLGEGGKVFDKFSTSTDGWKHLGGTERGKAKRMFEEKSRGEADGVGVVREEGRLYVVVGFRKRI